MKKLNKLFAILIAVLGVSTLSAQTDVTSQYLTNAGFESVDGWTIEVDHIGEAYGGTYYKLDTGTDPNTIEVYHTWAGSSAPLSQTKNFKFSQKVTLPAGEYRLKVNGFYREGAQQNATTDKAWAFAGTNKQNLVGIGTCGANNMGDAANVFKNGGCLNEFDFTITESQEIEIGFQGYINTSLSWVILGPVTLLQYSMDDFNAELTAARTKLQDVTGLNTKMANKVAEMLSETENVAQTKAAILEATAKVNALYNEAVAMSSAIVDVNAVIATCENMLTNSTADDNDKSAFSAAISTAKTNLDNATDVAAVAAVLPPLNEARKTYIQNADPTNETSFDCTFLITNPSFELGNTDGWNHPSASDAGAKENSNGTYTINGADGNYVFNIWNNSSIAYYIQQTVTGLPSGLYTLKAIVASDANHVITLTAGDKATDVTITSDKSTATEVVVENVVCSSGSLLIKASSANWFKADHFRLYYNGFDAATAQENVKSLKSQAEALVGSPMDADAAAALNAAIAGADATKTTRNELTSMIDALNAAIEAVENWRRDYSEAKALLVAALERFEADFNDGANGALRFMPAEAWNNILNAVAEAAKAKDVLDSYDGFETAANNLHAAMDAVYASYIKYDILENLTSLIGNADCTANDAWPGSGRSTKDDQHWSGQKRIYFAQNHENGAARSQTITLPKDGTYLLKVAVRAVEAASYAEILINGVSYKTVGAHGRTGGTIATDGTEWESVQAGIEAGKTFANNNQGYGWVYTYIYFDAKAGENTIAINLSNFNSSREANCGGMELYYLRPNYTVVEDGVVEYYGEFDEVTGTAYATHDVTNATLKENSIDVTANPNTFIIANENQVSNEDNVIVDGTAASLVLNEGYAFYAATDFTATAATYSREFTKDTWLTVCLPFAYDVPENVEVETLSTVEADTKTFVFNKVDVMEANKPYIIKNGTENNALFAELSNVEVKATPDVMSTSAEEGDAEFIGTYTTVTTDVLMENGTYDILFFGTDGQLYYLSDGITQNVITIDPFRAYIRLPKGTIDWENGAAQAIARHGEGTTGIENSTLNAQPSTVIYDLMGRKVTNMVKGNMYIVNGKKVIVK